MASALLFVKKMVISRSVLYWLAAPALKSGEIGVGDAIIAAQGPAEPVDLTGYTVQDRCEADPW